MLKHLFFVLLIVFLSCGRSSQKHQTRNYISDNKKNKNRKIGKEISGDFNGDGKKETATVVKIKKEGRTLGENRNAVEYEIKFSKAGLKTIQVGCCKAKIVNEGDLNNDKKDEISAFQAPNHGCTYTMTTYSYINRKWKVVVKPILIPTACEQMTNEKIQKRVFNEGDSIYYYETDPNNFDRLIKKNAD